MIAGCSMSDSTPPSDSAQAKTFTVFRNVARRLEPALDHEGHHAAEALHLLASRARAAGATRGPGRSPSRPSGASARNSAIFAAFCAWRSMRTCSVFTPRSTRKQSIGAGHAAHRVLQEGEPLGELLVAGADEAADARRSGRSGTWSSSARPRRRRARAGAGSTAS